jgi:hypothetical protein
MLLFVSFQRDGLSTRNGKPSSNIQLKRLEPPPHRRTPRTLPPGSLFRDQHIHALPTNAANALRTRIALFQRTNALARGAVDLDLLGAEAWRGVREAVTVRESRLGVEVQRFGLDGGEGDRIVGWVDVVVGRSEGSLEGRGGVALEVGGGEGGQGGAGDGLGGVGDLRGLGDLGLLAINQRCSYDGGGGHGDAW